uniref:RNA-directed DNA polymerase n=1 Tax=Cacopsylla melanoneura TaxID=428564 RepID=A0A8D8WCP2_9HEMI
MIAEHTLRDPVLSNIIQNINSGSGPENLNYTLQGKILFKDTRVCIPKIFQPQILNELHLTHPGIVKMKQLARKYCYWPKIDQDIEHLVRSCQACTLNQKSPAKAPTHHWEEPKENFSRIHIDYAGPKDGKFYLVLVDAKSKWPEIKMLNKAPDTTVTIKLLEEIFSFHGYPEFMVSDNATIFKSDVFKNYCKNRGIFQIFSAPGHPATNGLAERYVQILKSKLNKMTADLPVERLQQILQLFRATPLSCGKTPAELYLHRNIRIRLDAIKPAQSPPRTVPRQGCVRMLSAGDRVIARIYQDNKPAWEYGSVLSKVGSMHYSIKLDNGYTFKRHIDQLKFVSHPEPVSIPENPVPKNVPKKVTFADCPQQQYDIVITVPGVPGPSTSAMQVPEPVPVRDPVNLRRSNRERQVPNHLAQYHLG